MNDTDERFGTGDHTPDGTEGRAVKLSTHYYVLSLSDRTNRLYEAFRDSLIDIENTWFPMASSRTLAQPDLNDAQLRSLLIRVDHHFGHYYTQDPLGMVLAGSSRSQEMFSAVTRYSGVIIGRTTGDVSSTSVNDLGSIVWPIVKGVMASAGQKLERELEAAILAHNIASGIDAVRRSVEAGVGATLLVEESYRLPPPESSSLEDDTDNVVDVVIDGVLSLGGNVIFLENGSLERFQRIALILRA
ncbi:MAG TPA: hypothetical protein VF247_05825 [Candidatus Krumholzibacteria bacterium]